MTNTNSEPLPAPGMRGDLIGGGTVLRLPVHDPAETSGAESGNNVVAVPPGGGWSCCWSAR
jgi:hypothetical protein